ncbi:hypothetical protein K7914_005131 [Salmonella enterica]|nr:hypothetical protein [Salmonella enterica]EIE8535034.1 hypothetical protein [Salmonella enterica]
MKTTKAGTYNVGVALVPAGAAQPVSPVKTALVFLAGDPDPSVTTITSDAEKYGAPRAATGGKITLTVTARDAHQNAVPGWLLAKGMSAITSAPGVDIGTPKSQGSDKATIDAVVTRAALQNIRKLELNQITVNVGPKVSRVINAPYIPYVSFCVAPHEGADPEPTKRFHWTIGVAKWRACLWDIEQGKFTYLRTVRDDEADTLYGEIKPGHHIEQYTTNYADDTVRFENRGAVAPNRSYIYPSADMRGLRQYWWFLDINNKSHFITENEEVFRHIVGDEGPRQEMPSSIGVFVGYSAWSSSDRDPANMTKSAAELCRAVGGSTRVTDGSDFGAYPDAIVMQAALNANPDAYATTRVNTYGGGHDVLLYNGVPGDRGNGYYPTPTAQDTLPGYVYGIWNKSTVTKESISGTLNQNVQGAYCVS